MEKLLTIGEVAKHFRVSVRTVRYWTDQGLLPAYRLGPRCDRRFSQKDVDGFLGRKR